MLDCDYIFHGFDFKVVRLIDVQSYRIHSTLPHNIKFEGDVIHAFLTGISAK